jgi:hypothetical protein
MFFNKNYRMLKKMKYYAEQQGIINRYVSESGKWKQHLENTKNFIISSTEGKSKNSAAILGSGWLLDIPYEYLSANFKKVYFFDAIHPSQIRHKIRQYKNVELVESDITGGAIIEFFDAVQLYKHVGMRKNIADFKFNGMFSNLEFDFVASVNMLNQLDGLLVDYLKKYNIYNNEELHTLQVYIQQKHFNALPKGKSCLITDYEEQVYSLTNQLEETRKLVNISLPEDKISQRWQWEFDYHESYIPGKNVVFNVLAMKI